MSQTIIRVHISGHVCGPWEDPEERVEKHADTERTCKLHNRLWNIVVVKQLLPHRCFGITSILSTEWCISMSFLHICYKKTKSFNKSRGFQTESAYLCLCLGTPTTAASGPVCWGTRWCTTPGNHKLPLGQSGSRSPSEWRQSRCVEWPRPENEQLS